MPIKLVGPRVVLRPLTRRDARPLLRAASDGSLWLSPYTIVPSPATVRSYLESALERMAAGRELAYTVRLQEDGRVVGSTRFREPDQANRCVEVSHTWIAASFQRTFVNTEAKYLMLRFAFETLGCIRVQFRADEANSASRRSLERLGARQEGVLRKERIMPDGRERTAVLYSIVDDEWPSVRTELERRLLPAA